MLEAKDTYASVFLRKKVLKIFFRSISKKKSDLEKHFSAVSLSRGQGNFRGLRLRGQGLEKCVLEDSTSGNCKIETLNGLWDLDSNCDNSRLRICSCYSLQELIKPHTAFLQFFKLTKLLTRKLITMNDTKKLFWSPCYHHDSRRRKAEHENTKCIWSGIIYVAWACAFFFSSWARSFSIRFFLAIAFLPSKPPPHWRRIWKEQAVYTHYPIINDRFILVTQHTEVESSRTDFEVLGLGLEGQVLGLGLESSKIGLSSARGQHYFLNCWNIAERLKNFLENVFLWRSLEKFLWRPFFFFFWRALALVSLVLGLESVCPRKGCPWPWPRIFFVSLALASSLVSSTPPLPT